MRLEERMTEHILGIDPALSITGYAVITTNLELKYINKITTSSKNSTDSRINEIIERLFYITSQYQIKHVVLEDGFIGKNYKTGLQLAMLRGAIIGTFSFHHYQVSHMTPTEIRKYLGCGGDATKEQTADKIIELYKESEKIQIIGPYSDKHNKQKTSDMYDALATATAFVNFIKSKGDTNG